MYKRQVRAFAQNAKTASMRRITNHLAFAASVQGCSASRRGLEKLLLRAGVRILMIVLKYRRESNEEEYGCSIDLICNTSKQRVLRKEAPVELWRFL